ncbi:PREDICTED: uncharacterized protein LOC106149831 [Chinchilla lanigera]|uniref:uncharacterized protein LOC106149831 n=1 Tax=Chinchilla lanigera TaxID=34839 RepID=UPI000696603C|nr:PREDICTED: uncharacterized protein LOC106149831 [Chinchilla lanigera]
MGMSCEWATGYGEHAVSPGEMVRVGFLQLPSGLLLTRNPRRRSHCGSDPGAAFQRCGQFLCKSQKLTKAAPRSGSPGLQSPAQPPGTGAWRSPAAPAGAAPELCSCRPLRLLRLALLGLGGARGARPARPVHRGSQRAAPSPAEPLNHRLLTEARFLIHFRVPRRRGFPGLHSPHEEAAHMHKKTMPSFKDPFFLCAKARLPSCRY